MVPTPHAYHGTGTLDYASRITYSCHAHELRGLECLLDHRVVVVFTAKEYRQRGSGFCFLDEPYNVDDGSHISGDMAGCTCTCHLMREMNEVRGSVDFSCLRVIELYDSDRKSNI